MYFNLCKFSIIGAGTASEDKFSEQHQQQSTKKAPYIIPNFPFFDANNMQIVSWAIRQLNI